MTTAATGATPLLRDRAARMTRLITDVAADELGIVRCAVYADGRRALEDADCKGDHDWHNTAGPAAFHAYEDAGMTTGAFLTSQCIRYRVTGDADALRLARQTFDALCFIYDLGKQKAEGYFPKPYNRSFSEQISRDQYLFAMTGLAHYRPLADADTQATIDRMRARMARYWIGIDYTDQYFNLPPSRHLDDFMGALFLGLIRLGGDDADITNEYERLAVEENLAARMGETLRARFRAGETYDGAMYFRQQENPVMMKSMAVDCLWRADAARRDVWAAALQQLWRDDGNVALDPKTGLNYFLVGYDRAADATFLTKPGVIDEIENPLNFPAMAWGGLRQSAGSTQTAYAAAVVADRLGDAAARDTAVNILRKVDLPQLRGWTVPDESHLPPGDAWRARAMLTAYAAYWLWTYWLGCDRGLWSIEERI